MQGASLLMAVDCGGGCSATRLALAHKTDNVTRHSPWTNVPMHLLCNEWSGKLLGFVVFTIINNHYM